MRLDTCPHPEERRHYDWRRTDGFSCDKCGLWIDVDDGREIDETDDIDRRIEERLDLAASRTQEMYE